MAVKPQAAIAAEGLDPALRVRDRTNLDAFPELPLAWFALFAGGEPAAAPEDVAAPQLFTPAWSGGPEPALYREAFWPRAAWKNRALLDLAEELMAAAREVRPGLRFALNLYYETILNPRMALAWYAQSIQAAGAHPFDYYSLMSYHRQIAKELTYTPEEALEAVAVMSRQVGGRGRRPGAGHRQGPGAGLGDGGADPRRGTGPGAGGGGAGGP